MYIVIYVYVYLQKASHTATPRYRAVTGGSSTPRRAICATEGVISMPQIPNSRPTICNPQHRRIWYLTVARMPTAEME